MRVELIVCADCVPCEEAREVWSEVCREGGCDLVVVPVEESDGEAPALSVIPAIRIDGRLVAVGVQSPAEATALLRAARRRAGPN